MRLPGTNIIITPDDMIGPEDHQHVMQQISDKGLFRPTSAQIIYLLDASFQNKDDPLCKDIIDKLRNKYLWTATEHTSESNEGIFVYDNIFGIDLSIDQLMQKFDSKDEQVRFTPYGFKTKNQSINEFINNPYVINHFGEKAMPSVERVVKHIGSEPYASALLESEKSERRYCELLLDKITKGFALHGAGKGTGKDGYAFGIKNS